MLLFVILLVVVFAKCVSDNLLYIMNICQLVDGIVGSSAEWYGDSVSPTLSYVCRLQPRETSVGFLLDSREFLVAAELVLNRATGVSIPAYFLLARSIELSLKAFLLADGVTPRTLGSKAFGHNLVTLLSEAVKRQLHDSVPLDPIESNVVELLSYDYFGTRLAYRVTGGTYYLPLIDVTEQVARKLVVGIEAFCIRADPSSQQHREV